MFIHRLIVEINTDIVLTDAGKYVLWFWQDQLHMLKRNEYALSFHMLYLQGVRMMQHE